MALVVWKRGESALEEGRSFKVWGKVGGWTSKLGRRVNGVIYGKVFVWVRKILAKILSLLLGWGIE